MRPGSPLAVHVRDNQATPVSRGILSDAYGLRFTTLLPGGCGECTFRVPGTVRSVPPWANYGYEVQILDGGEVLWAGRIEDVTAIRDRTGESWEIGAAGWGVHLDDEVDTSETLTAGVATTTFVTNHITNFTEKIGVATVTASGVNVNGGTLTAFYGRQLMQVMMLYGDSANNAQQWHVYPQADGDIEFTWEDRPATASVYLSLDDLDSFAGGIRGARLANQVIVRYASGASTSTANDTTLQGAGPAGWGFTRTAIVTIPEITNATDAAAIAAQILEELSTVRMAATSLTLKSSARLFDANGAVIQPWRMRAGKLAQISDLVTATGALGDLSWNNSFLIAGTAWDEDTQTLELTPERHDKTLDEIVGQLLVMFRGRHALSGTAS